MSNKNKSKKRAHDKEGKFVADDPTTPDVNEAYEQDAQPTPEKEPGRAAGRKKLSRRQIKRLRGEWVSKFKTKFKGLY
jgi:hypothetical protein